MELNKVPNDVLNEIIGTFNPDDPFDRFTLQRLRLVNSRVRTFATSVLFRNFTVFSLGHDLEETELKVSAFCKCDPAVRSRISSLEIPIDAVIPRFLEDVPLSSHVILLPKLRDQIEQNLNLQLDKITEALGPDFRFSSINIGSLTEELWELRRDYEIMKETRSNIMAYISKKLVAGENFSEISRLVITVFSLELRCFLTSTGPQRNEVGILQPPSLLNLRDTFEFGGMTKYLRGIEELRLIFPSFEPSGNPEDDIYIVGLMLAFFKGKRLSLEYKGGDPKFGDPFPRQVGNSKPTQMQSLRYLTISKTYVPKAAVFRLFLTTFPRLMELRLVDIKLQNNSERNTWGHIFDDLRQKKKLVLVNFKGLYYGEEYDQLPCDDLHQVVNPETGEIVTSPINTSRQRDPDSFFILRDKLIERRSKKRLEPDPWLSEFCQIPGLLRLEDDEDWEDEEGLSDDSNVMIDFDSYEPYFPDFSLQNELEDSDEDGHFGHYNESANCHPQ